MEKSLHSWWRPGCMVRIFVFLNTNTECAGLNCGSLGDPTVKRSTMSSIRARLLTTILSLALLGALSIVLGAGWMSGDLTGLALDREVKNAQFQLQAEIEAHSRQALLLAKVVAGQTDVQAMLADRNRDGLEHVRLNPVHIQPLRSSERIHWA